jgi:hypothetical protein
MNEENKFVISNKEALTFTTYYNRFTLFGIEFTQRRQGDDWILKRGEETLTVSDTAMGNLVWGWMKGVSKESED